VILVISVGHFRIRILLTPFSHQILITGFIPVPRSLFESATLDNAGVVSERTAQGDSPGQLRILPRGLPALWKSRKTLRPSGRESPSIFVAVESATPGWELLAVLNDLGTAPKSGLNSGRPPFDSAVRSDYDVSGESIPPSPKWALWTLVVGVINLFRTSMIHPEGNA
jgi:hypothetical protein